MKFGFDIDDTLINLREHAFHLYNKKLQKEVHLDYFHALKTVEIHEPFGLNADEGKNMWTTLSEEIYFTDCPPYPNAVEFLQRLTNSGHEVYYITARNKEFAERTKEWMKTKGFPVKDEQFFCGMADHEKIDVISSLDLDFYMDDKPAVLNTLAQTGVHLLVKDQSYNKDLSYDRVHSWAEVWDFLNLNEEKK
ncbi:MULTISPECIES: HAD family acid phosphatase [unclassified Niallia]|uniref:5' nucleotidase, NT5C type n=1 Tax=unclassified Niallia TaxID=2837522 RepID=UPI001EDB0B7C|nr:MULTISPECIES: HAD family acid phosphatase [unclassified Niallia]MDL0435270.1 HAD family acid phosphatase [Niallia sp. SS-2023]UPO86971.1 hypothetical protein L8T27_015580 [Niallia sp. Man26]